MLIPEPHRRGSERRAVLMLLLACLIWGMGFNWNKQAQALLGAAIANASGDERLNLAGPACFLAIRFFFAAVFWCLFFPRALRGWTWETIRGGALGGALLAGGMLLQHYGLASTSESLSAFLTSLTVLFTPLLVVAVLRQRVSGWLWASVACATLGVGLMTLKREAAGFDLGVTLGALCALTFSAHILVVDRVGRREDPWRFTAAQFLAATVVFALVGLAVPGAVAALDNAGAIAAASVTDPRFMALLALTTLPGTVVTFGIMFRYQPDTTPTRAALTYLSEPIVATAYAWLAGGEQITGWAMLGGLLILMGNAAAEFLGRSPAEQRGQKAPLPVEAILD